MRTLVHTLLIAAFSATLGGAAVLTGQAVAGGYGGRGMTGRFTEVMEELDLTDAQKADLLDLRTSLQDQWHGMRDERGECLEVISGALDQDPVDRNAIHAAMDARLEARKAVLHGSVDDVLDFYDTLDATQRATLRARVQERRGGRGPHGGHGGRGDF